MINNVLFRPLFLSSIVLILIFSCTKTSTAEEPYNRYKDYILVDEINMKKHNYTVQLLSELPPHVGYNNFAVKVLKKGTSTPIEGAQVVYWPSFKTATATYSTYVEQSYSPQYKYMHNGGVVFTSPSSTSLNCHLAILVREPGQSTTDTVIFDMNLKEPEHSRVYEFVYEESAQIFKTYYVTLMNPLIPKEGTNSYEVLILKRNSNASVTSVQNFSVFNKVSEVSGNTNYGGYLTHTMVPGGHYVGSVVFTKLGKWNTTLTLTNPQRTFYYDKVKFALTVGK